MEKPHSSTGNTVSPEQGGAAGATVPPSLWLCFLHFQLSVVGHGLKVSNGKFQK